MAEIDVDAVHAVREFLRAALGRRLADPLRRAYRDLAGSEPYRFEAGQTGRRALRNLALAYLLAADGEEGRALCLAQYAEADNMTDRVAALGLIAESDLPERAAGARRLSTSAGGPTPWWSTSGSRSRRWRSAPGAVEAVTALLDHEAFTLRNPNRVRALVGAFALGNPTGFHRADGAGYRFVADRVLALDPRNPQVAARLAQSFGRWRRYDAGRQTLMRTELDRILATPNLSRDLYEIASKSLQ